MLTFITPYVVGKGIKIPKKSKEEMPNNSTEWRFPFEVYKLCSNTYSLPFQLCVNHPFIKGSYLPPTKEFIFHVLKENSEERLLDRYDNSDSLFYYKVMQAKNMLEWIDDNGGLENIEFIYSLDT